MHWVILTVLAFADIENQFFSSRTCEPHNDNDPAFTHLLDGSEVENGIADEIASRLERILRTFISVLL